MWQLEDLESREFMTECLLDYAAASDNLEATKILLPYSSLPYSRTASLCSAFLLSCKNGHQDLARLLVTQGADPELFIKSNNSGLRDVRIATVARFNALEYALKSGGLRLTRTVLTVRQHFGVRIKDAELRVLVQHFHENDHRDPDPYLCVILELGGRNEKPDRPGLVWLSWLVYYPLFRDVSNRIVKRLSRLVLQSFYWGPPDMIWPTSYARLVESLSVGYLKIWLETSVDDVLIRAVDLELIKSDVLLTLPFLQAALSRYSSRAIESIMSLGLNTREAIFNSLVRCVSDMLTHKAVPTARKKAFLGRTQLWELLMRTGMMKLLEEEYWFDTPRGYGSTVFKAIQVYKSDLASSRFLCLTWVRCCLKMKGALAATQRLCHELQRVGGDGNFALNFPAGYYRAESGKTWVISREIRLAVQRWNFQLNRAHGIPYSESDIWYMQQGN